MPKAQGSQTTRGAARANPIAKPSSKAAALLDGANAKTKTTSKGKPKAKTSGLEDTAAKKVAATKTTGSLPSSKKPATKKAGDKPATKTAKSKKEPPTVQSDEAYQLFVRLSDTEDPTITRVLHVPAHYTFEMLHMVLQIAFGWAQCHKHVFNVRGPAKDDANSDSFDWDSSDSDEGFGPAIMSLMPKADCEDLKDTGFSDPDDAVEDEATVTLKDFYFPNGTYQGGRSLEYVYDLGDDWTHNIVFLGTAAPDFRAQMHVPPFLRVFCVSGEGHPCAEDCGNVVGWEDLKDAFRKPKGSRGAELREWYKNQCINGDQLKKGGLDPYKWDVYKVNEELHDEFK